MAEERNKGNRALFLESWILTFSIEKWAEFFIQPLKISNATHTVQWEIKQGNCDPDCVKIFPINAALLCLTRLSI